MAYILLIDTSTEEAIVAVADGITLKHSRRNTIQKEHAAFLHLAVEEIMKEAGISIEQLAAVSVTEGPGSYTGLRVGMAAAKGFAFALNIPLITIGTLPLLARAVAISNEFVPAYYCPMLDARRQEVFTALYTSSLQEIMPPSAVILAPDFLRKELENNTIAFFGSGMAKWKNILHNTNALFIELYDLLPALIQISFNKYTAKEFAELAHSQPLYVKEFYNGN